MASIFSESHTILSEASSWHRPATGRGALGGETRAKDLLINIKANFSRDKVYPDLGA